MSQKNEIETRRKDKEKMDDDKENDILVNLMKLSLQSSPHIDGNINIKQRTVQEIKSIKRNEIWKLMENHNLIKAYPPSCFNKIPNFKGCGKAAEKLTRLREFRRAKYVKINPSLAQMHIRFLTLRHQKILLVPSPALGEAFMYFVDPSKLTRFWQFKRASSKAGAKELGRELNLSEDFKINLYVVASTVCANNGVRLGKGLGYAELEWAILYTLGLVDKDTVVMTTVHDCQVLTAEELPTSLMCCHDLPVDVIVTPTRIVNVSKKLTKPAGGIFWELVSDEQLKAIPILMELKPK